MQGAGGRAIALRTCRPCCPPACARAYAAAPRARSGARDADVDRRWTVRVRAADDKAQGVSQWEGRVGSVGTVAAYGALLAYAFLLSPNQTPLRDTYFIEKLLGITSDPNHINSVFWSIFFLMGNLPLIFAALMVPSARSRNGVPLWPFLAASFGVGVFGLFPYLCLWKPEASAARLAPPAATELRAGKGALLQRAFESRAFPAFLLASTAALVANAAAAGTAGWVAYLHLFDESRFVHVTTVDFCALTALLPFFMWWDADQRRWQGGTAGVAALGALPLFGPLLYLLMRPVARLDADKSSGEASAPNTPAE